MGTPSGRDRWLGGPRPPQLTGPIAALAPAGIPGIRSAMHEMLRRVFGARRPDTTPDDPDPGLFGPGSPSWRVIAEPGAIIGGIRALLLQTMHPLAMAGVADHSRYREDPLGRLQRTSLYVTTSTFGTVRDALAVARTVRRTHAPVHGTAPDGRPYRADDPRLLTWVSVTLTSSFLAADRLWAPDPVPDAEADRFVAEQSRLAALLDPRVDLAPFEEDVAARERLRRGGVDLPLLTDLPADVDDLVATMDSFDQELRVGGQAREAMRFLRWPPLPPTLLPTYLWLFAGAAGSLHPSDRRRLGLPGGRAAGVAAVAHAATAITVLRVAAGRSPAYAAATARLEADSAAGP